MNTITIELCAEDRARLDRIFDALTGDRCRDCVETVQKRFDEAVTQAQTVAAVNPADEHPVAEPFDAAPEQEEKAEETKAPTVTLEQIRQKVTLLAASGAEKKAKAREIISAYGTKVSDLPADKWDEVYEKLTALEG